MRLVRGDPEERYSSWIAQYDTLTEEDLVAIRAEGSSLADLPPLSVVVPTARASEAMISPLIDSLLGQAYERWEATFVGEFERDGVISKAASREERFRLHRSPPSASADACNAVIRSAAGDFIVFVDPLVTMRPHTLFLLARTVDRRPDALLVYADDDAIAEDGTRSDHYFKPDWNEALLRSQNYIGGVACFRRARALEVGGCQEELDDDSGWGLFLRLTASAPPERIHHLPFILSHRRGATRREKSGSAVHRRRLASVGENVDLEPVGDASFRLRYALPEEPPTVSVIVPSTCRLDVLGPCVEGVLNRTSYPHLELVVVANGLHADAREQRTYLQTLAARPRARVLFYEERPFNFAKVNNWAAAQAEGDLLCFLNDDTEVTAAEWLTAMVAEVLQDRVAAVGAMLLHPNGRIQHAGVVLGAGGAGAHAYRGRPRGARGYHDRAAVTQDVSSVTAACMLVQRDAFTDLGGFDETLAISFNDIDLCLRLRSMGWRIVWTPSAELLHRESTSLGMHYVGATENQWEHDWDVIHTRWRDELLSDPHYSPNLSLDVLALWQPAFPPRVSYPWRADLGAAEPTSRVR